MSTQPNPTIQRLPALDLLRFVAAMAVTLYHYVSSFPSAQESAQPGIQAASAITRYGYLGVDLFFIISGFVILWSSRNRSAMAFAESRAGRLFPTFWVAMLLSALIIVAMPATASLLHLTPINARVLAGNATMVPGVLGIPMVDGVYWTLEVEIRFYALVFALLLLRQMQRVEIWLHAWLAVSIVCALVEVPRVIGYLTLDPYGPLFVGGCLFYLVMEKGWNWSRIAGVAVAALASAALSLRQRSGFITPDDISAVVVPLAVLAFFAAFTWLTLRPRIKVNADLAYRLGALTYPLYLIHGTVGILVFTALAPMLGVWPRILLITALALALAYLLSHTAETHGRKLFERALGSVLDLLPLPGRQRRRTSGSRGARPGAQPEGLRELPQAQREAVQLAPTVVGERKE